MASDIKEYDFFSIGKKEAASIGPFGKDDYPVAVTCYRNRVDFKSRKAAKAFFAAGAMCCGGSEGSRYTEIVRQLDCGMREVNDGCL